MTWLEGKPGRAAQRQREHRRRDKPDSRRSYCVRRSMGLTVRYWGPESRVDHAWQTFLGKASSSIRRRFK